MNTNLNKHLSLDERKIIETGVTNGSTKTAIAKTLGKDNSTIGKEIKLHRRLKQRNSFVNTIDCSKLKTCPKKPCRGKCDDYEMITCKRRDRSPGVCNGCVKKQCRLDKYYYHADKAHKAYIETLIDSREGINLTKQEIKDMANIIVPLIKKGQSVYHIITSNPELNVSEKTIYNYIGDGVFREYGLLDIDLRRKVKRKPFKKVKTKKREDRSFLIGRTFNDFKNFIKQNPGVQFVEMDTVYNEQSGPYIQTFSFPQQCFMFGILHNAKTSEKMATGIDGIYITLGDELFRKLFPALLTDRGSEFSASDAIEKNSKGELRTRVFYCDPMQSSQKPHVENNHISIRYILPKETSIKHLNQEKVDLMFSHINSAPRESLNGKSPYEMMEFLYGEELLEKLNIKKIDKEDITLKPYLLK